MCYLSKCLSCREFEISALGHNSAEYLHLVIEAVRLGFADAINYIADPSKVGVPIQQMVDKSYASKRRNLIQKDRYSELFPV